MIKVQLKILHLMKWIWQTTSCSLLWYVVELPSHSKVQQLPEPANVEALHCCYCQWNNHPRNNITYTHADRTNKACSNYTVTATYTRNANVQKKHWTQHDTYTLTTLSTTINLSSSITHKINCVKTCSIEILPYKTLRQGRNRRP